MSGPNKHTGNLPPIAPGRGSVFQQTTPKLFMWHELTPEREKKLIAEGKVAYIDYTEKKDPKTGNDDPKNAYMRAGIPPEQAERLIERSKTGQALITRAPRESGGGTMNTDSMRLPPGVPKTNFSSKAGNVTVKSTKVGPAKNMFRANVAQGTLDANDTARMHAFLYRELLSKGGDSTDNMQKMNVTKEDILHSVMTGEDFKKFVSKDSTIETLPPDLQTAINKMKLETDPIEQKRLFKELESHESLHEIVTNKSNQLHKTFFADVLQYKRIPVMQCENRVEDIMRNITAGFYTIDKFENGKLTFSTPEEKGIQYQVNLSALAAAAPKPPLVAMDAAHASLYSDPTGPLGEHAAEISSLLGNIYYSNVKLEVKEEKDATFKPLMVAADEVVTGYKKENGKIVEVRETCAMKGDIDRFSAGMPKTPFIEGSNTPVNTFLRATNIDSLLANTQAMFNKIYEIHNNENKSGYDPEHVALSKQYMSEIEKALLLLPKNKNLTDEERATLLNDQKKSVWKGMLGKSDLAGLTSLAGAASPHEFFTGVLDNFCSSCDPNNSFNTHYNHGMELRNPKKPSNLNAAYVIFLDGQNHYCPDEKSMTQTLVTAIQKDQEKGGPTFFEKTRIELDPRWAFTVYDTNYAGTPEQKEAGTLYEDKDQTVQNWQAIFSSKIEFHASEIQKAQAEIPPNTGHIKVQEGHLVEMKTKMTDQISLYAKNYSDIDTKLKAYHTKMDAATSKGSSMSQPLDPKLLEEHADIINQQREMSRLTTNMPGWETILNKIDNGLQLALPPVVTMAEITAPPQPPVAPIISMETMMIAMTAVQPAAAPTMQKRQAWQPPGGAPVTLKATQEPGFPPSPQRDAESAITPPPSTPKTTVTITSTAQSTQPEETTKRSVSRP